MPEPSRFTPETMRFLRGLAKHNERPWFEERRPIYERAVKAPLHALVQSINTGLEAFAPEHIRAPHKIALRIFRDTRFSPDKRPYKTHLGAWWARGGFEKNAAAGFYLDLGPERNFIAAGVYAPERDGLLTLRRWLAEHHERYRAALHPLLEPTGTLPPMEPLPPDALTRNPKGFPADHPASDLLRARNWGVTAALPPEAILSPTLGQLVLQHFRRIAPLVHLLNEPFVKSTEGTPTRFLL